MHHSIYLSLCARARQQIEAAERKIKGARARSLPNARRLFRLDPISALHHARFQPLCESEMHFVLLQSAVLSVSLKVILAMQPFISYVSKTTTLEKAYIVGGWKNSICVCLDKYGL